MKSSRLVNDMKHRLVIDIEYVYQDIKVKLNVLISYDKAEPARRFLMHLTMMTIFDQMLNNSNLHLMIIFGSIEYLMQSTCRRVIEATV